MASPFTFQGELTIRQTIPTIDYIQQLRAFGDGVGKWLSKFFLHLFLSALFCQGFFAVLILFLKTPVLEFWVVTRASTLCPMIGLCVKLKQSCHRSLLLFAFNSCPVKSTSSHTAVQTPVTARFSYISSLIWFYFKVM